MAIKPKKRNPSLKAGAKPMRSGGMVKKMRSGGMVQKMRKGGKVSKCAVRNA